MSAPSDRPALVGGLLVGVAGVLYGVSVVLGKWVVSEGLPAQSSLAIRFATAALLLAVVLAISRKPLGAARGERRWLIMLGGVGYAVETSFFFAALGHGTAAAVTLLFYTYPVFATVAHVLLGRGKPIPAVFAALGLSLLGAAIVIVTSGGVAIDPVGVVFVIGAAVSFTVYMLGSEHFLRRTSPMTSSMWLCASASVGLIVMSVSMGAFRFPETPAAWLAIAGMGVATAGAFTCFLGGLRRVGAVRTGIISTLEPLSAAILAWAFLAEPLGLGTIMGGALIMVGAVIAIGSQRSESVGETPMEPLP